MAQNRFVSTKGVVLSFTKYRDTSIVVKIFTRELGLCAFLVNGVRAPGKKTGMRIAHFQPLTQLDMVVYNNPKANLARIKELRIESFNLKQADFAHAAVSIFCVEFLNMILEDNASDEAFFDFLTDALLYLNKPDADVAGFPVVFLLQAGNYLGFGFSEAQTIIDIYKQYKAPIIPEKDEVLYIQNVFNNGFGQKNLTTKNNRVSLLQALIHFYKKEFDYHRAFKSINVLKEVFN